MSSLQVRIITVLQTTEHCKPGGSNPPITINKMDNVQFTVKGDILTITVDLSKPGTPSASGKTMVIASTKGNKKIAPEKEIFMGLNVYRQR